MFELILEHRLLAILRGVPSRHAAKLADHLYRAGIRLIEVALSDEHGLPGLCELARHAPSDFHIGAGTVISEERAQQALEAGARYLVTPHLVPEVNAFAKQHGVGLLSGATTPTEIQLARAQGSQVVKLFPAGDLGVGYLKSLLGPYPEFPLVVVGGIHMGNIAAFMQAGALGAGIGSYLTETRWEQPDFAELEKRARQLLELVDLNVKDTKRNARTV